MNSKGLHVIIARMFRLHILMKEGPITARALAESEEVSARTIRRTIDLMHDDLGCEINADHRGYHMPNSSLLFTNWRKS